MTVHKTEDFEKELKTLPVKTRSLFEKQESIFRTNWLDSRLHAKRIKEMPGVYSFRVTRQYRVLFYFSKKSAILFYIGHRKDVY